MHTIKTQDLIEISLQSKDDLEVLVDILKEQISEDSFLKTHAFPLVCELVWLNSSILWLLRRDLVDLSFKDEDQKEVIVTETTIQSLTAFLIAAHSAQRELSSIGYSLKLH